MNRAYFELKDHCRKGLLKYLEKAISILPVIENPQILDAGCGSGVPTLFLAEKMKGEITAIDSDAESLAALREKIEERNLSGKVHISNGSLFDLNVSDQQYDLVVAEGLLNVVGFQKGFLRLQKLAKRDRFIIIHDEHRDHIEKIEFIENNGCKILDSFVLDEQIWWNDYFKCLEKEISSITNQELLKLFQSDLQYIQSFKENPSQNTSVYYVIERVD